MARNPFGGTGADLVYGVTVTAGQPLTSQQGVSFRVFTDSLGNALADITTPEGAAIVGSVVTTDTRSQLQPFLGPPNVHELWIQKTTGGEMWRIYQNGGPPGPAGSGTGGSGAVISLDDPMPLAVTADPGDSTEVSAGNHVHPVADLADKVWTENYVAQAIQDFSDEQGGGGGAGSLPGIPDAVTAVAGNAEASVYFLTPSGDPDSYEVLMAPTGLATTGSSSPIDFSNLVNGTGYSFRVRAHNEKGWGQWSNPSNTVVPAAGGAQGAVPGAPTNIAATAGDAQANVYFQEPSNTGSEEIDGYEIVSNPGNLTVSGSNSPINIDTLSNGTAYTFRVRAHNSVGWGSWSDASNVVTPNTGGGAVTPPSAPQNVTASASDGGVNVYFQEPASEGSSSINSYEAESSPGGYVINGSSSPVSFDGLQNGTTYYFRVRARNDSGWGPWSGYSAGVTPNPGGGAGRAPGVPTTVRATAGDHSANVYFGEPVDHGTEAIDNYEVESSPGSYTVTGGSSPVNLDSLSNGTSYTFRVRAHNDVGWGSWSGYSNAVTPSTDSSGSTPPSAPLNVTASAGDRSANVYFQEPTSSGSSSINSYEVASSPGGFTVNGGSSPITVDGLSNGTAYRFQTRARNDSGWGPWSSWSGAVTPHSDTNDPTSPPGPPVSISATAGDKSAQVYFQPPTTIGTGEVDAYQAISSPGSMTIDGSSSPIGYDNLVNGTAYSFKVRAHNTKGWGPWSASSNVVRPAADTGGTSPPGPPTGVAATAGNAEANVYFLPPSNHGSSDIDGYSVHSSTGLNINGSDSPVTVSSLTNGQPISFQVRAHNGAGWGPWSGFSNSVTPQDPEHIGHSPPGPPGSVAATAGDHEASVTWSEPSQGSSAISGYEIQSNTGVVVSASSSPGTVSGLPNQESIAFRVRARNDEGWGPYSGLSNAVTPVHGGEQGVDPPGAPGSVAATAGDKEASVTWSEPGDTGDSAINSYEVKSSTNIVVSGASSPTTVPGLVNGVSVNFIVRARNDAGWGPWSSPSNSVTPTPEGGQGTPPPAPTNVTASPGDASANVMFEEVTGSPDNYEAVSSPGNYVVAGGSPPISVDNLRNGTAYTFKVRAHNDAGWGPYSASSPPCTPQPGGSGGGGEATNPPAAPIIGTVSVSDQAASVNFTMPPGQVAIDNYEAVTTPDNVTAQADASPIDIANLVNGRTYTAKVHAHNNKGWGAWSANSASFKPTNASVPDPPTDLAAQGTESGTLTITFKAPESNGGAAIDKYRATLTVEGQQPRVVETPRSPALVDNLTNYVLYTITVAAHNEVGWSTESEQITATPTVMVIDDFHRANQQQLGTSSSGEIWTPWQGVDRIDIVSNKGKASGSNGRSIIPFHSTEVDLLADVEFTDQAAVQAGLFARLADENNFVYVGGSGHGAPAQTFIGVVVDAKDYRLWGQAQAIGTDGLRTIGIQILGRDVAVHGWGRYLWSGTLGDLAPDGDKIGLFLSNNPLAQCANLRRNNVTKVPRIPFLESGDGQVRVTCHEPADGPPDQYRATDQNGHTWFSDTNVITCDDLENGTEFQVKVAAKYGNTWSPDSPMTSEYHVSSVKFRVGTPKPCQPTIGNERYEGGYKKFDITADAPDGNGADIDDNNGLYALNVLDAGNMIGVQNDPTQQDEDNGQWTGHFKVPDQGRNKVLRCACYFTNARGVGAITFTDWISY